MEPAAIEGRASDLSNTLHRLLSASSGKVWLLIDPILRPLQPEQEFDAELLDRGPKQVPSPSKDPDPRLMPQLVALDSNQASDSVLIRKSFNEALIECTPESIAQGVGRRICGWLESSSDVNELARHFARHLVQRRPTGGRVLLRWNDPAVLWALWPLLNPVQRKTLLGPIDVFHLIDPVGRLLTLQSPTDCEAAPGLGLSASQWADADAIRSLNKALHEWGTASTTSDQLAAARQAVMAALRRARALGFDDADDLATFGIRALTVHADFDRHQTIGDRLAKRESGDYFTSLVDDLTPEDWQRIRVDLVENAFSDIATTNP